MVRIMEDRYGMMKILKSDGYNISSKEGVRLLLYITFHLTPSPL